jgi:hypothetical protein
MVTLGVAVTVRNTIDLSAEQVNSRDPPHENFNAVMDDEWSSSVEI